MERYPDHSLPLAQLDKSRKIDTGFRTLTPSIGLPVFEKLTDDLKVTYNLKFTFTRDQALYFDLWVKHRLDNGSKWFIMPINIGGGGIQDQEIHFVEMPQIVMQTQFVIQYSVNVIAKELKNRFDDYADEILNYPVGTWLTLDRIVNFDMPTADNLARRQSDYILVLDTIVNFDMPDANIISILQRQGY